MKRSASGKFFAGAYSIDITPLPGQPMGGFGNDLGKIGRGHWTRLYANTTYLEDPNGNYVVIVATDLWSFPGGLGDYIVELLQESSEIPLVTRENILFAATHTHHSQGNFATSIGFNQGSAALPGFDPTMFEWLAVRLSKSIKEAIINKREATLSYTQFPLHGFSRNRSIEAFKENPGSIKEAFLSANPEVDEYTSLNVSCLISNDPDAFKAVNPNITSIIARDAVSRDIISLVTNVVAHPTALGPDNLLFSADIFGVASVMLQNYFQDQGIRPVVAFLNGESGDVSLNWTNQGYAECVRLGERLVRSMVNAIENDEGALSPKIYCQMEYKEINGYPIFKDPFNEIMCKEEEIVTASSPQIGKSILSGTEDGRVFKNISEEYIVDGLLDECAFSEGQSLQICTGDHGKKMVLAIPGPLRKNTPKNIPVSVIQLGDLRMIALPGEITTALGYRIKKALKSDKEGPKPIIVGLANEYLLYFTTPSEYNAQHYEGGFTLYGEASGLYLIGEVDRISTFGSQTVRYTGKKKYRPGPTLLNKRNKKMIKNALSEPVSIEETFGVANNSANQKYHRVEWKKNLLLNNKPPMDVHKNSIPKVMVEVKNENEWKELIINKKINNSLYSEAQNDLESLNFLNFIVYRNNQFKWTTIWMTPSEIDNQIEVRLQLYIDTVKIETSESFIIN